MMIDTASKPTGGYYVIDKWENNAMSFRTATNGPVVFTSSRHSWLPLAYADNKVMIKLSCVKKVTKAPPEKYGTWLFNLVLLIQGTQDHVFRECLHMIYDRS